MLKRGDVHYYKDESRGWSASGKTVARGVGDNLGSQFFPKWVSFIGFILSYILALSGLPAVGSKWDRLAPAL